MLTMSSLAAEESNRKTFQEIHTRSRRSLLRPLQRRAPLMNHIHNPLTLIIQILRRRLRFKASVRPNLHTLAGDVAFKEALESIDDAFDGCQEAHGLQLVVEYVCADVRAHDVGADRVQGDVLLGQVFAIAAGEACDATEQKGLG